MLLLQAFKSVRSERQLDHNLCSADLSTSAWTTRCGTTRYSKNCNRLLISEVAQQVFAEVNKHARCFMKRRALHRLWDADAGLGFAEGLPQEGWTGRRHELLGQQCRN